MRASVALSFGLSIAVVALLGLVVNVTPWGIRLAVVPVPGDVIRAKRIEGEHDDVSVPRHHLYTQT